MDDDMCCLLMAHLRQNSRVTSLDLSENRIGFKESSGGIAQGALEPQLSSEHGVPEPQPTIGEAIATMLEENSTLTNLELSWNFIAAGAAAGPCGFSRCGHAGVAQMVDQLAGLVQVSLSCRQRSLRILTGCCSPRRSPWR